MNLFDQVFPNATQEDRDRYEATVKDISEHLQQRPCPSGCGCTELFDDRSPGEVDGGFGVAGCECPRCNGDPAIMSDNQTIPLPNVTRIEVIDSTGRAFTRYYETAGCTVQTQDGGRTVKVFATVERKNE